MNGSEFLLYKGWKKVAALLASQGVKLSISTNGIRLTPENIKYLIDNTIVQKLNISMDGATKATVEGIRVNVDFDNLMNTLHFFSIMRQTRNSILIFLFRLC